MLGLTWLSFTEDFGVRAHQGHLPVVSFLGWVLAFLHESYRKDTTNAKLIEDDHNKLIHKWRLKMV